MGDTGNPLSLSFVCFNSALEIRVVDFTTAENKSSALMFISFDTYMKYVKRKKISIQYKASKSDFSKYLILLFWHFNVIK